MKRTRKKKRGTVCSDHYCHQTYRYRYHHRMEDRHHIDLRHHRIEDCRQYDDDLPFDDDNDQFDDDLPFDDDFDNDVFDDNNGPSTLFPSSFSSSSSSFEFDDDAQFDDDNLKSARRQKNNLRLESQYASSSASGVSIPRSGAAFVTSTALLSLVI